MEIPQPLDPSKLTMQQVATNLRSAHNPDSTDSVVPQETGGGFKVKQRYSAEDLLELIKDEEAAWAAGWNVREVKKIISEVKLQDLLIKASGIIDVCYDRINRGLSGTAPRYQLSDAEICDQILLWFAAYRKPGSEASALQAPVDSAVPQEGTDIETQHERRMEDPECKSENFHHDKPMRMDDY